MVLRGLTALVCLTLPLYVSAAINYDDYTRSKDIDTDMKVLWKIDGDTFFLGLEAVVSGDQGWVGFGISEAGGMPGADIVYFETASPDKVTDAHSLSYSQPVVDDCQDWTWVSSGVESGKLFVEATRKLSTGDSQDWKLMDDSATRNGHTIIAAWGDSNTIGYHSAKRKVSTAHLFSTSTPASPLENVKLVPGIKSADILHNDYAISSNVVTTYEYMCVDVAAVTGEDAETPIHILAVEPIIDEDSASYVHHFTVDGYYGTATRPSVYEDSGYDSGDGFRQDGNQCVRQENGDGNKVYIWGPGLEAMVFPGNTGLRALGNSGYRSLQIDTHYDNPSKNSGVKDNSGIRIWYTTTLQTHDIGVMQLGDPQVNLASEGFFRTLPEGKSKYAFSCTRLTYGFGDGVDEVTAFSSLLHMHDTGQRMEVRMYSGDGVLKRADQVQVYDFMQKGALDPMSVGGGFKVQRGDYFEIDCYYEVASGKSTSFGQGSAEEMCINYLYYFPMQPKLAASGCALQDWRSTGALFHLGGAVTDIGRTFGVGCAHTGFGGDLPFEAQCPGVSACITSLSGANPATCAALAGILADVNACFNDNGCCDSWQYAVDIWKTLPGLAGCDYTPGDSTCGARGVKKSLADQYCSSAVACVGALGLPAACGDVDDAWKEASAACFQDSACCEYYPYFLETLLHSSPALLAECDFDAGRWGGWCAADECRRARECVEEAGLPTQCSDVTETEDFRVAAAACFRSNGCCGGYEEYMARFVLPLEALAACDLDIEDLLFRLACNEAAGWVLDVEPFCPGVAACVDGVERDAPEGCGRFQAWHQCFSTTGCCEVWAEVVFSLNRDVCACAGDFGTFCGEKSEGELAFSCECPAYGSMLDCAGALAASTQLFDSCSKLEANLPALKQCFASTCCDGWEEWQRDWMPVDFPALVDCDWGEGGPLQCSDPPSAWPVAECGPSIEECVLAAAGEPSSCADVENVKGEAAVCFTERACCAAWPKLELLVEGLGLSGCDMAATCVDATLKVASFDVTLAVTEADFVGDKRTSFIKACAKAGGVAENRVRSHGMPGMNFWGQRENKCEVRIKSVTATTEARRHLLANGIVVATEMDVPPSTTPDALQAAMASGLNAALLEQGLPESTAIGDPAIASPVNSTPEPSAAASLAPTSFFLLAAMLLAALAGG